MLLEVTIISSVLPIDDHFFVLKLFGEGYVCSGNKQFQSSYIHISRFDLFKMDIRLISYPGSNFVFFTFLMTSLNSSLIFSLLAL